MQHSILSSVLVLSAILPPALAQNRTVASVDVEGGKVSVAYTPTALEGRSPADIPNGVTWRMSAGAAAQLTTTVPLVSRYVTLGPGSYNLSAKRIDDSKWQLILFNGPRTFQKGTPFETSSLILDEESEASDNLRFSVKSRRGAVRIKLHWGKHSLNTRFDVLPMQTIAGTLGGKPATFQFYGLRHSRNQQKLSGGDMLNIGSVVQKTDQPIRYTIHAQRDGNGVELVFKNFTLSDTEHTIAAGKQRKKAIEDFLENASDQQAERAKGLLEQLKSKMVRLASTRKAATSLKDRVRFKGGFEDTRQAASNLTVTMKSGDAGMALELAFGRKVGKFVIADAQFTKQR